jgi:hypothetical protein
MNPGGTAPNSKERVGEILRDGDPARNRPAVGQEGKGGNTTPQRKPGQTRYILRQRRSRPGPPSVAGIPVG